MSASSHHSASLGSRPIEVEYVTDDRPRAHSDIERQMAQQAEMVLREWDENVQRRSQDSFHLRPQSRSSPSGAERRRKRTSKTYTGTQPHGGAADDTDPVFEFPEINVIKREDSSAFDTSAESLDDDSTKQTLYRDCPDSAQKLFHLEFEVAGYDQKDISVKVSGSRLVVHALKKESADGRKSTTEFCRKVKLPKDVDAHRLQCTHAHGTLVVEAPLLSPSKTVTATPKLPGSSLAGRMDPVNTPLVKESAEGKCMNVLVEVGRLFRADDVVVKLKGQEKLIVSAHRDETNAHSKMTASLSREFDLPEKIQAQTLRAGLGTDGVLKVTALLSQQTCEMNL